MAVSVYENVWSVTFNGVSIDPVKNISIKHLRLSRRRKKLAKKAFARKFAPAKCTVYGTIN